MASGETRSEGGKGDERIRFDDKNALVQNSSSPDKLEISISLPLQDGAVAEIKITLGPATRSLQEDARYGYKIDMKTDLLVSQRGKATEDVMTVNRDGLNWELPMNYTGAGTALLLHEPKVKEFMLAHFERGKVFVDVGANVGAYSIRAAAAGMMVRSFEPNPDNAGLLKRNASINGLPIEVTECALGASNGTARLAPNGAISRITDEGRIEVPMRTLDSFEIQEVDLLKIDVEGYELEVLRGAVETLRRCGPALMIEMHDWVGAGKESALFEILTDIGYRFEYLDKYAHGRHLAAERPVDAKPSGSAQVT